MVFVTRFYECADWYLRILCIEIVFLEFDFDGVLVPKCLIHLRVVKPPDPFQAGSSTSLLLRRLELL